MRAKRTETGGHSMWIRRHDFESLFEPMHFFRTRLGHVLDEFDRVYTQSSPWQTAGNYPKTNMVDTGEALEIVAELPGVRKEDLNIKIQGNYLAVSGKSSNNTPEGYTVHRSERGERSFSRSFTLPYEVDAEKVSANLQDGLLKLVLPKSEAAKPRQITIN